MATGYAFLQAHPVFTTRQYAALCETSIETASRKLRSLQKQGDVVKVVRGIWAQPRAPRFSPYSTVGFLLGNEEGYVSFLSALHWHGLISQIPGSIQVATTGHSRSLHSPIGRFEFFRMAPRMMTAAIDMSDTEPPFSIARPEKALLDTLYISVRKGRRFRKLPEVETTNIDSTMVMELLNDQVPALAVKNAIIARLRELGLLE